MRRDTDDEHNKTIDENERIKEHYNKINNKSVQERNFTRNINIRNVHNFMKSCLFLTYIKQDDRVLDLGIGKGGDFRKYQVVKISELYGIDVANKSILDAYWRAWAICVNYKTILKTKDCYTRKIALNRKFDIVSIQFSFHYCFAKEEYVDTTIDNIARHLLPGGYVLITMPCKNEILRRRNLNRLSNKFYKIDFQGQASDQIYGNSYHYTLVDSVNDCVEYLVDMEALIGKMGQYGIRLVIDQPFEDFFKSCKSNFRGLYIKNNLKDLTDDEWEVMCLHHVVVFKSYQSQPSNQ